MRVKLFTILVIAAFTFSAFLLVRAETQTGVWRDDMNYQSLEDLQVGGWTVTNQAGVSFSGDAIILDGTQTDTAIHYSQHFPSGISDWKIEDKSRWTLGSHCGNIITAITNKHSYAFMADGWYGNFVFYRDGQKTTFGNYQESKNEWLTLSLEKQGNQINMYYNGELKSTYTETDTAASNLVGVDSVSPWKGGSEYDYFEVWQIGDASTQEAQESLLSNPIVIGGIIGAVGVGVGGVLYFFVFSGGATGGAAGSAGSGATGGGTTGSSGPANTGNTTGGSGVGTNSPHPAYATLTAHLQELQTQAQCMHTAAANLMNDPNTVGAGNALHDAAQIVENSANNTVSNIPPATMPNNTSNAESMYTQSAADALHAASLALHNAGATLLSNPTTASAGASLQGTAANLNNTAQSLYAQAQATKPPTVQSSNQTPPQDNQVPSDSGTEYSGGNPSSDSNVA